MRENCRIRLFSMNDYSTHFEQKNQFFEEKKITLPAPEMMTSSPFLVGSYIEKKCSPKCPLINLRKVGKFHVKRKTR